MRSVIRFAVFAAILYAIVVFAWPWVQEHLGSPAAFSPTGEVAEGASEATACVGLARDVASTFGSEAPRYANPPADTGAWMQFSGRIQREISGVRDRCGCLHPSCDLATRALDELDSLVYEMDGMIRGSTDSVSNPARGMERVYDLLDEAGDSL